MDAEQPAVDQPATLPATVSRNVPLDPAFDSPSTTRDKIRHELLPLAFENYRADLASPDKNLRHKASKEIFELAGVSPKTSAPGAGATLTLPPVAIAKMLNGLRELAAEDVEYEVIDVTGETPEAAAIPRRDPETTRATPSDRGGEPDERPDLEVADEPAFSFDPGETEGEWE